MRTALFITLILAVSSSARADGDLDIRPAIIVRNGDCQLLVRHRPSADVSAAPTDAYGRPVAPADESGWFRPPRLNFTIQAPTIERETWRSEPALIELSLDLETGEITSDGRPIPGLSEADLVKACSENLSEPRSAP